jgi:NitT/TauT family transport system substrate-binding protein
MRDMIRSIALLLTLAGTAALAAPAAGEDNAALTIATNPIDSGAEVYYAGDLGYFANAGLSVQIQPGQNGAAIAAAVAGNAVDIGYADIGALAKAHTRGIDFSIIAPAALWDSTAPVNAVMVAKSSPVRNAKDLNGKTIGVPGLGTAAAFVVFAWLDANGADSSTVKFIELPYSAMPAALDAGRIDAAHVAEPFISVALEHARVLGSADDALGKRYLRTVWFARTSWATAHPDLVARFVSVMRQTAIWANDKRNQAKSAAILVQHAKIDPALVASMVRAHYGESLAPALLQPEIDLNAKYDHFAAFPAGELVYKR